VTVQSQLTEIGGKDTILIINYQLLIVNC